jgi:hypothetical protein
VATETVAAVGNGSAFVKGRDVAATSTSVCSAEPTRWRSSLMVRPKRVFKNGRLRVT